MRQLRSVVIVTLVCTLLSACDKTDKTSTTKSPPVATTEKIQNISEAKNEVPYIDPNMALTGEFLYGQNCVFCHQADAIGKAGFAPSLTNQEFLAIARVDFLFNTIRDGRTGTGMPAFKHLGDENIAAIVAYLRDHAKLPSRIKEVDEQPKAQGDPRLGKLFFDQICATCHGPGGNGYVAGGTGTAIGRRSFLDKVSDGFIRVTVKEGRSNTRMLPFQGPEALADLSNTEIDDIISYLRTNPGGN